MRDDMASREYMHHLIRHTIRTMLWNVPVSCLKPHENGFVEVELKLGLSDVDLIWFEVSKDDIYKQQNDMYEIILYDKVYFCHIESLRLGREESVFLNRNFLSVLGEWVFGQDFGNGYLYGVRGSWLGQPDFRKDSIDISFLSSLVQPDAMMSFQVSISDVLWQKDYRTNQLAGYVNLKAPPVVSVCYKSHETGWHDVHTDVSYVKLYQDIRRMNRMRGEGMSRQQYIAWMNEVIRFSFFNEIKDELQKLY